MIPERLWVVIQSPALENDCGIDREEDRISGPFETEGFARDWAERFAHDPWGIFQLHDPEAP